MNVHIFRRAVPPNKGFAPTLFIPKGVFDTDFYLRAFDAVELRRFLNDDGSIHVSELALGEAMFHLHEVKDTTRKGDLPFAHPFVEIGLFVDDVHAVIAKAVAAGAELVSAVQDYDYGYRQGSVQDPFGHIWKIQQAI